MSGYPIQLKLAGRTVVVVGRDRSVGTRAEALGDGRGPGDRYRPGDGSLDQGNPERD